MVRLAVKDDMDAIEAVYAKARVYMAESGNPTQWGSDYPPAQLLLDDIEKRQLFVIEENGEIHGVFAFIIGEDPSYSVIENGCWKYNRPYGTIHRIAGDGTGGIFDECMRFCKDKSRYLRIDTHEKNSTMIHCIAKHGFERSGIVYMPDKSPRIAFEFKAEFKEV